ncbi:MAG: fimbrial protein pilin [Candidatus Saccharibacteria bacterium]|nr:fimbrial protein pilin [Candidatus Saccharibacteria bacterium]
MHKWAKQKGFTIVELLIVIVVIGILAAITIVAYNGIQQRGRDARRLSDIGAIKKALELYKTDTGTFPTVAYTGLGTLDGWEDSSKEAAGEFLTPLKPYGFSGGVTVDPINDATDATMNLARSNKHYGYLYYKYPAGNNGCDANRGAFYVLGLITTETSGSGTHPQSPGFSCSYDWQTVFSWVTGGYEK